MIHSFISGHFTTGTLQGPNSGESPVPYKCHMENRMTSSLQSLPPAAAQRLRPSQRTQRAFQAGSGCTYTPHCSSERLSTWQGAQTFPPQPQRSSKALDHELDSEWRQSLSRVLRHTWAEVWKLSASLIHLPRTMCPPL